MSKIISFENLQYYNTKIQDIFKQHKSMLRGVTDSSECVLCDWDAENNAIIATEEFGEFTEGGDILLPNNTAIFLRFTKTVTSMPANIKFKREYTRSNDGLVENDTIITVYSKSYPSDLVVSINSQFYAETIKTIIFSDNKLQEFNLQKVKNKIVRYNAEVAQALGYETEYDSTKHYYRGEVVWKNGALYQFKEDCPAGGSFDDLTEQKTLVQIINELSTVNPNTSELVAVRIDTTTNNAAVVFPVKNPTLTVYIGDTVTTYRIQDYLQAGGLYIVTFSVPYGESYTLSVSDIENYTTPTPHRQIASKSVRNITFKYQYFVDTSSISILCKDESIYAVEDVNDSVAEIAVGVLVPYDNGKRFLLPFKWVYNDVEVIKKTQSLKWFMDPDNSSNSTFDVPDLAKITKSEYVKLDFNGKSNSDKILAAIEGTTYFAPACEYCNQSTITLFKNGDTEQILNGYLLSFGQLWAIRENNEAIQQAFSVCGYKPINYVAGRWWSSSQVSATNAWGLGSGSPGYTPKALAFDVRPVYDF